VRLTGVAFALLPLYALSTMRRRRHLSRALLAALALGAGLALCVLAIDPVGHLNNRLDGWLGGTP
jgi:hypothetical protein